ncbi:MAG: head-tail connector protein [Prevotella sp.]|nr:head-tail connector protein [Prevotella sp.]
MANSALLEMFKRHIHADDVDCDDDMLQFYLDAAEQQVVRRCDCDEDRLYVDDGKGGRVLPKELQLAVLLLASHYNDNRADASPVQMHSIPDGVEAIIKGYTELVRK